MATINEAKDFINRFNLNDTQLLMLRGYFKDFTSVLKGRGNCSGWYDENDICKNCWVKSYVILRTLLVGR